MPRKDQGYVLKGGREGYDRLLLLARDRWPDTKALFEQAGLAAGMHCADIGCGGGAVSLEIARIVGPTGSVVGIDMDKVKLELARREASAQNLQNVHFREGDAADWSEPSSFDVVYSRFLLQHLRDPRASLKRMWDAVRPSGLLIIEDIDADGWFCEPANEGFEYFRRIYPQTLRSHGGDPIIGRKMYALFLGLGIPAPTLRLVQSIHSGGDLKTLAEITLQFASEAIASGGDGSVDEIHAALASLSAFTKDPTTLISGPRVFQVWSRR